MRADIDDISPFAIMGNQVKTWIKIMHLILGLGRGSESPEFSYRRGISRIIRAIIFLIGI